MARIRVAAWLTVQAAKEHPVLLPVGIAALDAIGGFAAQPLADDSQSLNSLEAFAIGALAGTIILLVLLFAWYWATAPRRVLEVQVGTLAEKLDQIEEQLIVVAQQVMGNPDDLQPIYVEVRSELREAARKVGNASDSGQLWGFVDRLPSDAWKKHKENIRSSPWADAEIHGQLTDAYRHIDRLNQTSSVRWFNRSVKPGDDLASAFIDLLQADQTLSEHLGDISLIDMSGDDMQLELDEEHP